MNNTRALTRTGILIAINLIFLMFAQIIRSNTLSFIVLASFITGIAIVYVDFKHSLLLYVSTTILAFILIPEKSIAVVYAIIFGNYGIIKIFIERVRNNYSQFILKTLYFFFVLYLSYVLIGNQLINLDSLIEKYNFPIFIFMIMFALLFNLYDFLYSIVINFIHKRIKLKG